ncbi:MAG: transglutaminase family protein [Chloroflexota bacterium]
MQGQVHLVHAERIQTLKSVGYETMNIRVGCDFHYETPWPTPTVMQIEPYASREQRIVRQDMEIAPTTPTHEYRDSYGNTCRRFTMPGGDFRLRFDAVAAVADTPDPVHLHAIQAPVDELPDETLLYTMPSRYCLSDVLSGAAWDLFGETEPGWGRVQTICDWVHENIRFQYGTSTPLTTAVDVYESRVGVCRDFAHLGLTFCRAMNIPARYVFGYLPDIGVPIPDAPMDFCGWFEAYLEDRWWTFDPRNNTRRVGRVVIARGRDALDVAMFTTYGSHTLHRMVVWADEEGAALPAEALRVGPLPTP